MKARRATGTDVLVTEGEQRAALAAVRSLGRAGHRVHVTAARLPSLAGSSRWAASERAVPDPLAAPAGYAAAVSACLRERSVRVLLPTTEAGLLALLPLRDCHPGVAIPFPSLDTVRRICDKAEVLAAARDLGIAVPEQVVVAGPERVEPLPADWGWPVIVKPSRSVVAEGGRLVRTAVVRAGGREELERVVADTPRAGFPLLVQRRIRGYGTGVFLLVRDGAVAAAFAHRRLREKPPSGGVSVLCESVALEAGLLERSRALLERFGWEGVAMVEYKVDAETGVPVLMEVNGRFWGSLQLAVDAGVDFPALLVAHALGERVGPAAGYRTGVRSRWWWGEVDHLVALLRARDRPPDEGPPRGSPWRGGGGALLRWLAPARNQVFRWSDPTPFLRETRDWVRAARR